MNIAYEDTPLRRGQVHEHQWLSGVCAVGRNLASAIRLLAWDLERASSSSDACHASGMLIQAEIGKG